MSASIKRPRRNPAKKPKLAVSNNVNDATATQNFSPGQEIMTMDAIIVGPVAHPKIPLCIGCAIPVDTILLCTDCGWPICNSECSKLILHRTYECEIFKKCKGISYQSFTPKRGSYHQYDCILPLRLLILSEKSPTMWDTIKKLQSYKDIRKDTATWRSQQNHVVNYIRRNCKLKKFDEELIHEVCGILDANCMKTNTKNGLRCMFLFGNTYLTHSCLPNTTCIIDQNESFKVSIKAAVNIRKGDILTYSKVRTFLPTILRRQELIQDFCFICSCERCKSATELDTHLSSFRCRRCKKNVLVAIDPLDFESDWRCINCKNQMSFMLVKKYMNEIQKEFDNLENSNNTTFEKCEILLTKFEDIFHRNHAFMVLLKCASLAEFNKDEFYISDLITIENKIITIYELLKVFDVLAPGYSSIRGIALQWLYKAHISKAKYYLNTNENQLYKDNMDKALNFLQIANKFPVS